MPPPGAPQWKHWEAFQLRRDRLSYPQIAEKMGIGVATAHDWVRRGAEMEAEHGGPDSQRDAKRHLHNCRLDKLARDAKFDIKKGRWDFARLGYYELQRKIINDQARLDGAAAAPARASLDVTGIPSGSPLPSEVAQGLAALARSASLLPLDDEDDEDDEAAG